MVEDWREQRRKTFERNKSAEWPPKDPQPRKEGLVPTKTETIANTAEENITVSPASEVRRVGDVWHVRENALRSLESEGQKPADRMSAARRERIQRMRSPEARRNEKRDRAKEENIDRSERVRRINILLRAGVYDRNRVKGLPDVVKVPMTRRGPGDEPEEHFIEIPRSDIDEWLAALEPYERQRLYVLGRKKIDFKMRRKDYPEKSDEEFEQEKAFQKEQKRLADALEIVALPMLRTVFRSLGHNVRVYLTSANDDIAGGLDVAIDFYNRKGKRLLFNDGTPMRFVVDMTYARMRNKVEIDLDRGRIAKGAYDILKGKNDEVPRELANARAMKLFRTVVETLGGTMSTLTFDKKGPLEKPQEHVPRLIVGLDWQSAFSAIAEWVEYGDDFPATFKNSDLARRIAQSIENQLKGLHSLAARFPQNPNTPYLADLLTAMRFKVYEPRLGARGDKSLDNIDRLLTLDTETSEAWPRRRLERAALAQIAHDAGRGSRVRGDTAYEVKSRKEEDDVKAQSDVTMGTSSSPPEKSEAERLRHRLIMLEIMALRRRIAEAERRT